MPILDNAKRVIGICAGIPEGSDWGRVNRDASSAIETAHSACMFADADLKHRRGDFPALAVGASFGGGQTVSSFYSIHFYIN